MFSRKPVSPDLSTTIAFGVINIITSAIAVLIAYLTLRYMVVANSMFPHLPHRHTGVASS
jgi:hypothetical protein